MENIEKNMVNETERIEATDIVVPDTSEKRFTQAEVNEILKKRLSRYKNQEASMRDLEAREAEVTAKENWLNCREYLLAQNYPEELVEFIDTSDVDEFMKKADKANKVFRAHKNTKVAPLASNSVSCETSFVSAFENTKHTPRQFPLR